MSLSDLPSVSVITVNYNGASFLDGILESLAELDYPKDRLEIIVVDNGSSDGSVKLVQRRYPWARVLPLEKNTGFVGGNNAGTKIARGNYLAFVNNDMRVDRHWLKGLVEPIQRDPAVVSTSSKILNWKGDRIDFVGGSLNFYGHGFQVDFKQRDVGNHDAEVPLLFPCGGSMLVQTDIFRRTDGFDRDYFAYFEDVDLGWRLWVLGYKVMFAPQSVAYHHHHGTAKKIPDHRLKVLYERNALSTMYKNYDDANLARILPGALLLTAKRAMIYSRLDGRDYRIQRSNWSGDRVSIPKTALSPVLALDDFTHALPLLEYKRRRVQSARRRPDDEIFSLFRKPFEPSCPGDSFLEAQDVISTHLGVREMFANKYRPKILLVCDDPVGERMAGPAIRAVELGRVLARTCDVTLAAPGRPMLPDKEIALFGFQQDDSKSEEELRHEVRLCDVVVTSGFLIDKFPFLSDPVKPLVVDLYDPFVLENLELHSRRPLHDQITAYNHAMEVLTEQLAAGDYFICASERQKHFWMGMLTMVGRIDPVAYSTDKTADSLLGIVPFGLPSVAPVHSHQVLKGVVPGIGPNDRVLLWGGGIWDWFDPLTLIRAMREVAAERPDAKLFFMSKTHPSSAVAGQMSMPERAETLARELGLLGSAVFFSPEWIPYDERQNYLGEADLGVSCHYDHVETRYSFRTRILDYIWAGLPIVCTSGDSFGDLVVERGLGATVPPEDASKLARAILDLLAEPDPSGSRRAEFDQVADELRWERVAEPLVSFCHVAPKRTLAESLVSPDDNRGLRLRLNKAEKELETYKDLVDAYRRGKFISTMEKVQRLRNRIFPK